MPMSEDLDLLEATAIEINLRASYSQHLLGDWSELR
jgi:hypothetical protein